MMGKMKIFLISLLMMLFMATTAGAVVDVLFNTTTMNVERNDFISIYVVASSDVQTNVRGIEANFDYDPAVFRDPDLTSFITSWANSTVVIDEDTGHVIYQKENGGQPYYFTVNGSETIYYITFQVSPDAAIATTQFDFDVAGGLEIWKDVGGVPVLDTGISNFWQIGILEDTTPPDTTASQGSDDYNTVLNVYLSSIDPYGDLNRIHYTTNGSTPNLGSDYISAEDLATTPVNIPENAITTLMFFGVDNVGNAEEVNTEVYTIDTIAPVISNLVVSPNFAKAGEVISINFTLAEAMTAVDSVSVKIAPNFTALPYDGSYPDYEYYYVVQGTEAEVSNNVIITVRDTVNNENVDTSEQVAFDFTPPTYSDPIISAISPTDLFIRFTASEALNIANTELITASGNYWTYDSNEGLDYIYGYKITGAETSRLVEIHGYDLAGNDSWNTEGWNELSVSGEDPYGNPGQNMVTVDIRYDP